MMSGPAPTMPTLADGFCFGEGPRWFEGLLWFSDMLGEAVHTVTVTGRRSVLPLPGHAPSGLGFRPDGTLLIVSTRRHQLLGYDGETVTAIADLSTTASADLGDMVVDDIGRAYIGVQARGTGVIMRVDPDGTACTVATDLDFPNGMVITEDRARLIVAESVARRLSVFDISADGTLTGRRVFADGLSGPPDGITLDADGGVWSAMTLANGFERITEGGVITDRIDIGDRIAIACTIGGPDDRTLFLVSSTDAYPQRLAGTRLSRIDAVRIDIGGAGLP